MNLHSALFAVDDVHPMFHNSKGIRNFLFQQAPLFELWLNDFAGSLRVNGSQKLGHGNVLCRKRYHADSMND